MLISDTHKQEGVYTRQSYQMSHYNWWQFRALFSCSHIGMASWPQGTADMHWGLTDISQETRVPLELTARGQAGQDRPWAFQNALRTCG